MFGRVIERLLALIYVMDSQVLTMKITSLVANVSGAFALVLALAPVGMSQTANFEDSETESSESIEEIIVYGEKSIGDLRRDVYEAQENFFELFNSLNLDHEYDVNCYYEAPTGTRIRNHVCKANFVVEATSVQYVELRTSGPRYPTLPSEHVIPRKKKILRQKIEALVAQHPELLQALMEYANKRTILESAREDRN